MLSNITKKTCGKSFTVRGIYSHLKNKHNVERPSDKHKLVGFQMGNVPTAIFMKEGKNMQKWIKKAKKSHNFETMATNTEMKYVMKTPKKPIEHEIIDLSNSEVREVFK